MRASAAEVRARMRRAMVVARAAPGVARVPGASRRADRLRPAALAASRSALPWPRGCGRELGAVRRTGRRGSCCCSIVEGSGQVPEEEMRQPSHTTRTAAEAAGWSHGHRDVSGG